MILMTTPFCDGFDNNQMYLLDNMTIKTKLHKHSAQLSDKLNLKLYLIFPRLCEISWQSSQAITGTRIFAVGVSSIIMRARNPGTLELKPQVKP